MWFGGGVFFFKCVDVKMWVIQLVVSTEILVSAADCRTESHTDTHIHTRTQTHTDTHVYTQIYAHTHASLIYPITTRVVGAPQLILQPVSSIFPCSLLPSGTWRTPGLSIP